MWLPDLIRKKQRFRDSVIKSDSGVSSKSYVMVEGMELAKKVVYWYLIILTIEMFTDYVLRSNWVDFAAVVVALSGLILASAWGKIKGEQSYWNNYGSGINNDDNINGGESVG